MEENGQIISYESEKAEIASLYQVEFDIEDRNS